MGELDFSPISNLGTMAIGLAREARQTRNDELQNQAVRLGMQKAEMDLAETKRQQEADNKVIPISDVLPGMDKASPNLFKFLTNFAKEEGAIGSQQIGGQSVPVIRIGDLKHVGNLLNTSNELKKGTIDASFMDVSEQITQIEQALSETKPDSKEALQAQEQLKQLKLKRGNILNMNRAFAEAVAKEAAKAIAKPTKIDKVDLGNRVEVYEDGVLVRTEEKGPVPRETTPETNPEIIKLQNAMDKLPPGDSKRIAIQKRIDKLSTPAEKKETGGVTWTTATNNLSKRFGSQDAIGNIIITPGLQNKHRLAQKKLVELKKKDVDPLEAINTAEDYANQVEAKYQEYMTAASKLSGNDRKAAEAKINAAYKKKYGYLPR